MRILKRGFMDPLVIVSFIPQVRFDRIVLIGMERLNVFYGVGYLLIVSLLFIAFVITKSPLHFLDIFSTNYHFRRHYGYKKTLSRFRCRFNSEHLKSFSVPTFSYRCNSICPIWSNREVQVGRFREVHFR